jgi:cystathionine beta-lyase/cystathionine gamma-synthase
MKAHEENAMKVAEFLETQKLAEKVLYPGLPSPIPSMPWQKNKCTDLAA